MARGDFPLRRSKVILHRGARYQCIDPAQMTKVTKPYIVRCEFSYSVIGEMPRAAAASGMLRSARSRGQEARPDMKRKCQRSLINCPISRSPISSSSTSAPRGAIVVPGSVRLMSSPRADEPLQQQAAPPAQAPPVVAQAQTFDAAEGSRYLPISTPPSRCPGQGCAWHISATCRRSGR